MDLDLAPPSSAEIGRSARRGVAWFLTTNSAGQAIQFVVGVALARLLDPRDFGTYGVALIFVGFASTLSQFGPGIALVQRREITEEHVSTMWVASLAINGTLCLALIAAAGPVAAFFGDPTSGGVLRLVALNFILNTLAAPGFKLLDRNLRFRQVSLLTLASDLGSHAVSITLALLGFGVWSLAWGRVTAVAVRTVGIYLVFPWRPTFRFSWPAARELFGFSGPVAVKGIVVELTGSAAQIVVGRLLGNEALGLYIRARALVAVPMAKLGDVVNPVILPAFSRFQDDLPRVRAAYRKVVSETSGLGLPALALGFLLAPAFIPLVYGTKWVGVVKPFRILCGACFLWIGPAYGSILLDSLGLVRENLKRQLVSLSLVAAGSLFGSRWGLPGVCWALLFTAAASLAILQIQVNRAVGMRWADYVQDLREGAVGGAAMLAAVGALQAVARWQEIPVESFAYLLGSLAVGGGVFLGLLYRRRGGELGNILRECLGVVRGGGKA